MIQKEEVAADVDRMLKEAFRILEDSIYLVNEHCSAVEAENYRHKVGKVLYALIFDLWQPLYIEHPGLKLSGWDEMNAE